MVKKKPIHRVIACILVLTLLAAFFPAGIFAEEKEDTEITLIKQDTANALTNMDQWYDNNGSGENVSLSGILAGLKALKNLVFNKKTLDYLKKGFEFLKKLFPDEPEPDPVLRAIDDKLNKLDAKMDVMQACINKLLANDVIKQFGTFSKDYVDFMEGDPYAKITNAYHALREKSATINDPEQLKEARMSILTTQLCGNQLNTLCKFDEDYMTFKRILTAKYPFAVEGKPVRMNIFEMFTTVKKLGVPWEHMGAKEINAFIEMASSTFAMATGLEAMSLYARIEACGGKDCDVLKQRFEQVTGYTVDGERSKNFGDGKNCLQFVLNTMEASALPEDVEYYHYWVIGGGDIKLYKENAASLKTAIPDENAEYFGKAQDDPDLKFKYTKGIKGGNANGLLGCGAKSLDSLNINDEFFDGIFTVCNGKYSVKTHEFLSGYEAAIMRKAYQRYFCDELNKDNSLATVLRAEQNGQVTAFDVSKSDLLVSYRKPDYMIPGQAQKDMQTGDTKFDVVYGHLKMDEIGESAMCYPLLSYVYSSLNKTQTKMDDVRDHGASLYVFPKYVEPKKNDADTDKFYYGGYDQQNDNLKFINDGFDEAVTVKADDVKKALEKAGYEVENIDAFLKEGNAPDALMIPILIGGTHESIAPKAEFQYAEGLTPPEKVKEDEISWWTKLLKFLKIID